jgi:hypothetical protein
MNPRVVLIGFVAIVLAATMTFVTVTNDERVGEASETAATPTSLATQQVAAGVDGDAQGDGHAHETNNPDHAAELEPDEPLDNATRDQLSAQLVQARDVALRYPTVADAEAGGYRIAGGFAPLVGAHYVAFSAAGLSGDGPIDVEKVNSLIYDGTSPTSRIVGLMYYGMTDGHPEGFAGPNDHWHRHTGVCIKNGPNGLEVPFPADADVKKSQCDEVGGNFLDQTGWMVHAWVVPGWDSRRGVFSHDNPSLHCADGTDETDDAGFCAGT